MTEIDKSGKTNPSVDRETTAESVRGHRAFAIGFADRECLNGT